MAKRKRLTPASITATATGAESPSDAPLETKVGYPLGVAPPARTRAPIAQVAGEASAQAALTEVAEELQTARDTGRLVQMLALEAVKVDHLHRDRMVSDAEEMAALKASIAARGQQTAIEVVDLGEGQYGLISGWRRLQALSALRDETDEARFEHVQALIKPIETVSDSYVAMVEENEIRADLSYYERARLACEAA
ncbi:MAG: ParB N-terminal domain-containing protein, partial [Pseudomonadota bacterium]